MATYIGAKLHAKQLEFANAITSTKETDGAVEYYVLCCSRQFGKSFILQQLLLHYAINEPNSKNLFITMTYSQCAKVYNEIVRAIEGSGVIRQKNGKENSIILINGSEVYFRSYQRADFVRGLSATTLVIDEAAFVADNDFNEVFRPTLSTIGRRCLLFSTPRSDNYFKVMFDRGLIPEFSHYHSYKATYHDNPMANLDEIEDARRTMPDKIFRAEYLAEFVSGSMSVFDNYRNCISAVPLRGEKVAGIDVGRINDSTVLTVFDGNVASQYEYVGISWAEIVRKCADELVRNGVRRVWVEVNGVGDPFIELLRNELRGRRSGVSVEAWLTTSVSKANIIERLITDFQEESIVIPNDASLLLQLDNFEAQFSKKSRNIFYGAKEPYHDDRVLSLAIANANRPKPSQGHYKVVMV